MGHIIDKEYIINNKLYVVPARIVQLYPFGRTTVWRYLCEMKAKKKYKGSFLDLGHKLKLVILADFDKFLKERGTGQ